MVAAGLDTLPGNINMTMAYLSSPHGQQIQKDAYEEIMRAYEGEDPWHEVSRPFRPWSQLAFHAN